MFGVCHCRRCLLLSLSLSLSLSRTHTHTHRERCPLSLSPSLSLSHTDALSLSFSPTLSFSLSLTLSLTHTHLHSLSFSLFLSLTHSLAQVPCLQHLHRDVLVLLSLSLEERRIAALDRIICNNEVQIAFLNHLELRCAPLDSGARQCKSRSWKGRFGPLEKRRVAALDRIICNNEVCLPESVYRAVFQKSSPAQIYQLILYNRIS